MYMEVVHTCKCKLVQADNASLKIHMGPLVVFIWNSKR